LGVGALAVGYFLAYVPFAGLTRALSTDLLPGVDVEVGGLVLLPAAAIGVLVGTVGFLCATGWWRSIGLREVRGRRRRMPGRAMLVVGTATAVIIGTTILNFTFVGVSILFMLLLMRAGTLCLAPLVDLVHARRIRTYAWVGLVLSLTAIAVAFGGVDAYGLTLGAVLSLAAYLLGYVVRFHVMSVVAKTGDDAVDRRYFAEEQITAATALVLICGLFAVIGAGPEMRALRVGFTEFLVTPEALLGVMIGLFYSALYVLGTLIYLDPREYTWAVPVNRAASVLAVAVASYALTWLFGVEPPTPQTLAAAGIILLAIAALSYPQLRALVVLGRPLPPRRLVVFVCEGNTGRSPSAAALLRSELARWPGGAEGIFATSAGVAVRSPGAPMAPAAAAALEELGVRVHPHGSQPLTRELCSRASLILCMTSGQRDAVVTLAPEASARTLRLDPQADLPIPERDSPAAWASFAVRVRELVRDRLGELPGLQGAPSPA
jgi:protein-tyrosine-phosphatase